MNITEKEKYIIKLLARKICPKIWIILTYLFRHFQLAGLNAELCSFSSNIFLIFSRIYLSTLKTMKSSQEKIALPWWKMKNNWPASFSPALKRMCNTSKPEAVCFCSIWHKEPSCGGAEPHRRGSSPHLPAAARTEKGTSPSHTSKSISSRNGGNRLSLQSKRISRPLTSSPR